MTTISKKAPPRVIDLFAGVGGLSLGACRAGFDLHLSVEKDPHALRAHAINFPKSIHSSADISQLAGNDLLRAAQLKAGDVDGIIGGPPCQGFSTMGRRDVGDERNLLFLKFFQLVKETRPRFFLAENVPGILHEDFRGILSRAFNYLDHYEILPPFEATASKFGAATTRRRILFIGYLRGDLGHLSLSDFMPKDAEITTVKSALAGLPTKINESWDSDLKGWRKVRSSEETYFGARLVGHIPDGVGDLQAITQLRTESRVSGCIATKHDPATVRRFAKLKLGEIDHVSRGSRLDPEGFCPTLRAGTGSDRGSYQAVRPIHPTEPRVITPREAARLQGFPDWFRFDPTKWHSFRQIGNSVSPILAEKILGVLRERFN